MATSVARNLIGRHIVISGGANGIGKATALRLASQGASLSISDLNVDAGSSLIKNLSSAFPEQRFVFDKVDVSNYDSVKEHVAKASNDAADNRIAGLICAAGIVVPGSRMHETSIDTYLKTVSVNMNGTFYYNHAMLATFVEQNQKKLPVPNGGWSIVNIGSKAAVEGLIGAAAYCATKHGVLGMSRTNAKDYANEHVRCNVLCPGVTRTEMIQKLIDSGLPEFSEELTTSRVYMKRYGLPEEMAATISYLIGPDSSYMTGQALVVDGLWSP